MAVLNHILCCVFNLSNHLLDNAWNAWVMMMMMMMMMMIWLDG